MTDERPHDDSDSAEADRAASRRRRPVSSVAIPYGSDELSSFLSEEWETPWEINHTVTPPPR